MTEILTELMTERKLECFAGTVTETKPERHSELKQH